MIRPKKFMEYIYSLNICMQQMMILELLPENTRNSKFREPTIIKSIVNTKPTLHQFI